MIWISKEKSEELKELTGLSVEHLLVSACICAANKCAGRRKEFQSIGDREGEELYRKIEIAMGILMEVIK